MKIGVITYWTSKDNYGQLLQCFAMQLYLKQLGHSPFLIRYRRETNNPRPTFKIKSIFKYLINLPTYIRLFLIKRQADAYEQADKSELRNFAKFLAENIEVSEKIYDENEIKQNPPAADTYICGSDQIWGCDEIMHLSFAPDNAKKIAYAPSFGGVKNFAPQTQEMLKENLARFDFIGMREQSGVETCHELGFTDAVKVVDPTLLLNQRDYAALAAKPDKKGKYAFVYLLGNPIACSVNSIFDYIKNSKLDYVYAASQGRVDKYDKTYATINEWLGYIQQSEVVITNSFHCVVFSLIFHKPFIFVPLSGEYVRMNGRIEELLDEANLSSQILDQNFEDINLKLDFSAFDAYQASQQNVSKAYLTKYLR